MGWSAARLGSGRSRAWIDAAPGLSRKASTIHSRWLQEPGSRLNQTAPILGNPGYRAPQESEEKLPSGSEPTDGCGTAPGGGRRPRLSEASRTVVTTRPEQPLRIVNGAEVRRAVHRVILDAIEGTSGYSQPTFFSVPDSGRIPPATRGRGTWSRARRWGIPVALARWGEGVRWAGKMQSRQRLGEGFLEEVLAEWKKTGQALPRVPIMPVVPVWPAGIPLPCRSLPCARTALACPWWSHFS